MAIYQALNGSFLSKTYGILYMVTRHCLATYFICTIIYLAIAASVVWISPIVLKTNYSFSPTTLLNDYFKPSFRNFIRANNLN